MAGVAFSSSPAACALSADPSLSGQEKQFVSDFRERWKKKFRIALPLDGPAAAGLRIIVGKASTSGLLKQADRRGLLDLKYLATRPNAEQAYAICCAGTGGRATAYLAANDAAGLGYALGTFEQLLSGLSKPSAVVLPLAEIVDWPDIRRRGVCGDYMRDEHLLRYARSRLNVHYNWKWVKVSQNKEISFDSHLGEIARGRRMNVQLAPILVHLDYMFAPNGVLLKSFPELAAEPGDKPFGWARPFCFAKPGSQRVLDEIFQALALKAGTDYVWVWPSEHDEACRCGDCKGDRRKQFTNEIRAIMRAYRKVRATRPSFTMDIITTQGSYPHNLAFLDLIPKSVGIDFYGGRGGLGGTYKTTFGETLLPPSVDEMRRQGYRCGAVPLLMEDPYRHMFFPFRTPQMIRLRMTEIAARAPDGVVGWLHWPTHDFNLQATAEFSWNSRGRTAEKFARSWATRKGLGDPELAARIVCMLEYPARALSAAGICSSPPRAVERMVSTVLGQKPEWSSFFDLQKGFEYGTHEDLRRVLGVCEEAQKLCARLGSEEFAAGARLLKQWCAVIERHLFFLESGKSPAAAREARREIAELTGSLPGLHGRWLDATSIDKKFREESKEKMQKTMKQFERLR